MCELTVGVVQINASKFIDNIRRYGSSLWVKNTANSSVGKQTCECGAAIPISSPVHLIPYGNVAALLRCGTPLNGNTNN